MKTKHIVLFIFLGFFIQNGYSQNFEHIYKKYSLFITKTSMLDSIKSVEKIGFINNIFPLKSSNSIKITKKTPYFTKIESTQDNNKSYFCTDGRIMYTMNRGRLSEAPNSNPEPIFNTFISYKDLGYEINKIDTININNRKAIVVTLQRIDYKIKKEYKYYFDFTTFEMFLEELYIDNVITQNYYDNYQIIGGVNMPFTQRKYVYKDSKLLMNFEYHWSKVVINEPVATSYFICNN
jgi:hypothetical protein